MNATPNFRTQDIEVGWSLVALVDGDGLKNAVSKNFQVVARPGADLPEVDIDHLLEHIQKARRSENM